MSRPRKGGRRRERVAQGCGSPAVTGRSSGLAATLSPHRASDKGLCPGETFRPPGHPRSFPSVNQPRPHLTTPSNINVPRGKGDHHGC
jgi:hypothetical protein